MHIHQIPDVDDNLTRLEDVRFFHHLGFWFGSLTGCLAKSGQEKDGFCVRVGLVPVEEVNLWFLPYISDLSEAYDSRLGQRNEEEWEPRDVLCR